MGRGGTARAGRIPWPVATLGLRPPQEQGPRLWGVPYQKNDDSFLPTGSAPFLPSR